MLNILMATNNNSMIKFFINNILVKNDKARLYKITNNIEQTTEVLNNNDIDIIILDLRILQNDITSMFDMIKKERMDKYKKSIIVIANKFDIIKTDCDDEIIADYILDGTGEEEFVCKLNNIIKEKDIDKQRNMIKNELKYIKYNLKYKGTCYLIDVIIYIYNNNKIDNLQRNVYPVIAKMYKKSVENIRTNLKRATDCMYNDCESKRLQKYFGLSSDDEKPTVKEVIYTVLDKIQ